MARLLLALLLVASVATHAQSVFEEVHFDSADKTALYRNLVNELRCLVCQNQNIADSNAELARDLRREIRTMITAGEDKSSIIDFMVQRYGEFVLYRPRLNTSTLALWAGPFAFLLIGLVVLLRVARAKPKPAAVDEQALSRARRLLQPADGDGDRS